MFITFWFAIGLGSVFIDFFDIIGGLLFVDIPAHLLTLAGSPAWLLVAAGAFFLMDDAFRKGVYEQMRERFSAVSICVPAAGITRDALAVKVNKQTGHVQVERIVCAQDMGEIINPQGAIIQIEGGVTMGLGYALSEELRAHGISSS